MSIVPEKIANFRAYGGASLSEFLGVADAELPGFEAMSETLTGAGIAGEYDSPTLGHLKAQSIKVKFRTATSQVMSMAVGSLQRLDLRGAIQVQDSASGALSVQALRVECRGPVKLIKPGKFEPGKPMDAELELSCQSVRISLDGKPVIEFDPLNFVYKVNGADYLAKMRTAMGG